MNAVQMFASRVGVGQQFGNYRLVRILGQGGFATIYLGEHRYLGTFAAVKVLHTQLNSEQIEKLSLEARIAARLVHPYIVRVLEFGLEGNIPFLVMDYAPHGTLRHRLDAGEQADLKVIVNYVQQITGALQYIHNSGLIHQDIKPENILFGSNDQALLSDFGIAITAHKANMAGTKERVGTIHYMAPEQLQGQPCFASDQYALGIVIYEWLCGEVHFEGSTLAITAQHLFNEPPSIRTKVSTVPVAVEQVIMRTLAKDPTQRFPTVRAFTLALKEAYKQSPVVQYRPPQPAPVSQPRGTKPTQLRQFHSVAPQQAYAPQAREPKPILLISRKKKPVVKRRNIWREIATIFAVDIAVGFVADIVLLILGLNIQTIWFLISLCLVSTPLLAAYATKNRPVFIITTSILAVASVLGIGFHSLVLFATVYGSLIFFSLLITFSGSLQTFKTR